MRHQLATPNSELLGPDFYNQLFTMHGTTMMFLFAVPVMQGFALYLVPLMIGARNTAFPRMTARAYWLYVLGGLLLFGAFVTNTGPDAGRFAYVPLAGPEHGIGKRADVWNMLITYSEAMGLMVAVDITTTILKLRAPGMTLRHMPLFVWASLVTSVMIIFAMPMVMLAANLVQFDRMLGTHFFNPAEGGDPLLWQHLFWFFGHPEVYFIFVSRPRIRLGRDSHVRPAPDVRSRRDRAVADRHRLSVIRAVGASHVRDQLAGAQQELFHGDELHDRDSHGAADLLLDRDNRVRPAGDENAAAFRARVLFHPADRRADRHHARIGAARPPGP